VYGPGPIPIIFPVVSASEDGAVSFSATDLLRWSEALSGIARTGLGFSDNIYERERFEEVLKVAADIRYAALRRENPAEVFEQWLGLVQDGVAGYVTPKVAIGAVVGNDHGELLLIRRSDNGMWLYPTGWADIGYSASEVAVKEVLEETGIEAEPVRLIAVFDSARLRGPGAPGYSWYSVIFHLRAVGGTLQPHPAETRGAGWFARDNLPVPMFAAQRWLDLAFRAIRGEVDPVFFDPPRAEVWRRVPSGDEGHRDESQRDESQRDDGSDAR
jgi:ADP-ribose pyrophosphatase YjhB (NUDIX family)